MTSISTPAATEHRAPPRRWRIIAGTTGATAGAAIVAGAFLPWVETFAGLISIPGVHGSYGRVLAAVGAGIAVAGLWHVIRGGRWARWLTAAGGFAALGFSGYLLIQLAATTRALGGDSMVLARGGPGLWVVAAGSLAAFATLFLPAVPAAPGTKRGPGTAPPPGRPAWPPALAGQAGRLRPAVLRWTADPHSAGARRRLQVALGLVWLLDAALQFQPFMFGRGFVTAVLTPAEAGNPAALASPALWADRLISHNVPAWNSAFALIQLAIALGLLWRPAVKAALAASIAWALSVWWLGEGVGGLLTGSASPVTGAPGAVILYALAALLVWPRGPARGGRLAGTAPGSTDHAGQLAGRGRLGSDVAAGGLLGYRGSRLAWLALWGGLAYLVLQPAVRAGAGLRAAIAGNAAAEPGWLAALDRHVAAAIGPHGPAVAIGLAAVFVLAGAGLLIPATARPAVLLAATAGLAIWVIGENFGMILMGSATDPNTGPLLVLLAAAYWPRRVLGSAAAARVTRAAGAARDPVDARHPA